MIGRLQGIIIEKQPPILIIDVNGVGYEVSAPMSTFYQLPAVNEKVKLFIHMVVREDAQLLYGFFSERERALFRSLIKVNGVGPKLALTILSGVEPDVFVRCVRDNNATSLTGIPGIGKKTAERLIIETRDALTNWELTTNDIAQDNLSHITTESNAIQDAISALTALGYKNHEAKRAILQIEQADASSEELIRLALQNMMVK
jgi:holliday junction DNA helicase RuvA